MMSVLAAHHMIIDEALVSLDLIESHLAESDTGAVADLSAGLITRFQEARMDAAAATTLSILRTLPRTEDPHTLLADLRAGFTLLREHSTHP